MYSTHNICGVFIALRHAASVWKFAFSRICFPAWQYYRLTCECILSDFSFWRANQTRATGNGGRQHHWRSYWSCVSLLCNQSHSRYGLRPLDGSITAMIIHAYTENAIPSLTSRFLKTFSWSKGQASFFGKHIQPNIIFRSIKDNQFFYGNWYLERHLL